MSLDATSIYWYDGQLGSGSTLSLPLQDPALLYGATVFTTLRIYESRLDHPWTAWQAHVARTQRSLHAFGWPTPDWDRLQQGAATLAPTYPVLRMTIFPDGRGLILGRSLPPDLAALQAEGAITWVADPLIHKRALSEHKTGNYLSCWLALQAARQAGAREAILVNEQGEWLETSTGNLWGWAEGCWWTPPLTAGILPGVLRSRIVQSLQVRGQTVMMTPWEPAQIAQFTCLAYTNSVVEVVPIRGVLQGAMSVHYNPDHAKIGELDAAWRSPSPNFSECSG
ncbi:MAG: aminotransferase class IV [Leptolyngbyaceae cyanobacterium]